ncbi:MAG: Hemin transport protein HmuS [Labilithrix sp.]|nr:Hemin transport protein HmuS [Labilithrix sp.]
MIDTTNEAGLRDRWMALRASGKAGHALELAEALGVAEATLLASACGAPPPVTATRLVGPFPELLGELPRLGLVKTVTRNAHAVIEVEGTYGDVEFFGTHMGQSVSSIDLRIFASRWQSAFAVREETKRGVSRGLQFFDTTGRAVHKLYLRDASDHAFYDDLVRRRTAADQSPFEPVAPAIAPPAPRPDAAIDVAGLRAAWEGMQDTHEFFLILRTFGVARTQALRLVGPDLARPVATASLAAVLETAAATALPIMVFVGNPGMIQIYTGPVVKVARWGSWINVLDPGFDLHVREDRVASAWVVRKPTRDGVVTALELYDEAGEQIALLFGKRKPGQDESPEWRAIVDSLA